MRIPSLPLVLAVALTGCSLDIVPVHSSRVTSAKRAEQPLLRGPTAPGAFNHVWKFQSSQGYLFDPNELEVTGGALRFNAKAATGTHEAMLVTSTGPHFDAIDSMSENLGPSNKAEIRYQLSRDNASWYYHAADGWKIAGPSRAQANSVAELRDLIGKFHSEVGTGTLLLRVFLRGSLPDQPLELREIGAQGVATPVDGWE